MYSLNNYEVEEVKKGIEKTISNYKLQLDIINNLKLLSKKDGSSFKDVKKCFDIESLKKHYNTKNDGISWLYLEAGEYDITINIKYNNIDTCLYLPYRVYLDELKENEKELIESDRICGGGFIREYFYLYKIDEIKKLLNKKKSELEYFLNFELLRLKNFNKLIKKCNSFIESLNKDFIINDNKYHNELYYMLTIKKFF